MEFWKAILGLVRRRSIGPPVIVVSIAIAALVYFLVPTRYVSSAFMVLTTPAGGGTLSQDPNRPNGLTNPLLQFNDGLRTTAGILIQALNTPEVAAELGVAKGSPTTVVISDGSTSPVLRGTSTNGPYVFVEGDSTAPAEASAVVVRTQQRVRDELVRRQQALGAPPSTFLKLVDVVGPAAPEAKNSGRWQAALAALVLGLLLGFGGSYGFERVRESRRRTRGTSQEANGSEVPSVAGLHLSPAPLAAHSEGG